MAEALPRGVQHLRSTVPHKFVSRFSRRVLPAVRYVPPEDRIPRWNVRPGDLVRLMVGKPKEKYVNETDSTKGWRIHEVTDVDMETGRLYLKGVQRKKSNPILPRPENWDELSAEDKQRYDAQQNFLTLSRPVHYSNVQLLVDQRPSDEGGNVFATRLSTSAPIYDKVIGRWRYDRFANKLIGANTDAYAKDEIKGLVKIPWPDIDKNEPATATPRDTLRYSVAHRTLQVLPAQDMWKDPATAPIAPFRSNTRDLPRAISDSYINASIDDHASLQTPPADVDSMMPLYLADELSPRFSRAKATKGWKLRQNVLDSERTEHAKEALERWTESGKDTGLESAMRAVGLDGVHIRSRTRKEVREAAEREYDAAVYERGRIARMAKRQGGSFDVGNDTWKVEVLPHIRRRMLNKAKKEVRRVRRAEAKAILG